MNGEHTLYIRAGSNGILAYKKTHWAGNTACGHQDPGITRIEIEPPLGSFPVLNFALPDDARTLEQTERFLMKVFDAGYQAAQYDIRRALGF